MSYTFSCIIPAFNEASRIAAVLDVAAYYTAFSQVIVVDDGSIDGTARIAQKYPVKIIRHKTNQGKSEAVFTALKKVNTSHVVLLDADLKGLRKKHLDALIKPHIEGQLCMTLSRRQNAFWRKKTRFAVFSGERVMPTWLLKKLPQDKCSEYALEAYVNREGLRADIPFISVDWPEVVYIKKSDKEHGQAYLSELKMIWSICKHFPPWEALWQQLYIPLRHK